MQLAASTVVGAFVPTLPFSAGAQSLDLEGFLRLASAATGHQNLDPVLGSAILDAFDSSGALPDIGSLQADRNSPARRALLRAWYLGKVSPQGVENNNEDDDDIERLQGENGDGEDADNADLVVGYEATLMGRVVSDLIPLRSYCGGLPYFWTEPPNDPDNTASGGTP
ncbi:MAG: sorbitol dehydrogenase family protein [Mesorhizobium sp.]|nr:sorbitol dehydrogenase family protein [Mesorhizobium sp.]